MVKGCSCNRLVNTRLSCSNTGSCSAIGPSEHAGTSAQYNSSIFLLVLRVSLKPRLGRAKGLVVEPVSMSNFTTCYLLSQRQNNPIVTKSSTKEHSTLFSINKSHHSLIPFRLAALSYKSHVIILRSQRLKILESSHDAQRARAVHPLSSAPTHTLTSLGTRRAKVWSRSSCFSPGERETRSGCQCCGFFPSFILYPICRNLLLLWGSVRILFFLYLQGIWDCVLLLILKSYSFVSTIRVRLWENVIHLNCGSWG